MVRSWRCKGIVHVAGRRWCGTETHLISTKQPDIFPCRQYGDEYPEGSGATKSRPERQLDPFFVSLASDLGGGKNFL